MQLNAQNIIGYLADRQMVSLESFLNGRLYWQQIRSRNIIFQVKNEEGAGLFVKQGKPDTDLIRKEAQVQRILHHFSVIEGLRPFIPKFHAYDPDLHILVTELLDEGKTVLDLTELRRQLTKSQATAMSAILVSFHKDLSQELDSDPSLQYFNRELPWILQFPNAADYAREVVLEQIRQDEFLIYRLDEVARGWKKTSLIHGDINLTNFIVLEQSGVDELKLVDWEMANIGDPIWDLAGLMQAYMASGLRYASSSTAEAQLPESKKHWAKEAVYEMWSVIWESYTGYQHWTVDEAHLNAEKLVGFMAAKLLQSAAELNRVSPEFLAPGAWAMIAEARSYFKQPQTVISRLNAVAV